MNFNILYVLKTGQICDIFKLEFKIFSLDKYNAQEFVLATLVQQQNLYIFTAYTDT